MRPFKETFLTVIGQSVMLILISSFVFLSSSLAGDRVASFHSPMPVPEIKSLPDEPGLGFPFAPPSVIAELRSFGITPWGEDEEEHFGIDIIPYYGSSSIPGKKSFRKVKVIAPAEGTIRAIWSFESDDAPGNIDIAVILEMNSNWSIILMFEPKSSPGLPVEMQVRSISVKAGEHVDKGDKIGFLVVGEGIGEDYPHVHYALLYKHSSIYYFDILQDIVLIPNLDADAVRVPLTGPGSPWEPTDLTLPDPSLNAAFFCPYQFSSPRAVGIFDHVIGNTEYPCGPVLGSCECVCIFDNTCEE